MSYDARKEAHALAGGESVKWCAAEDGKGIHGRRCDEITACLQRAYAAGLERAKGIARAGILTAEHRARADYIADAICAERERAGKP